MNCVYSLFQWLQFHKKTLQQEHRLQKKANMVVAFLYTTKLSIFISVCVTFENVPLLPVYLNCCCWNRKWGHISFNPTWQQKPDRGFNTSPLCPKNFLAHILNHHLICKLVFCNFIISYSATASYFLISLFYLSCHFMHWLTSIDLSLSGQCDHMLI